MDRDLTLCDNVDEDYIDIEVRSSSSSTYFCRSISIKSTSHPREFEFQMSSNSIEKEATTSPADELFYKGKLLPLHLPPRIQMVQKLQQSSCNDTYENKTETVHESYSHSTTSTPFDTCSNSPTTFCRVSGELNPDELFYDISTEVSCLFDDEYKKCWSKKLKLIKHSSFSVKLKASKAYFKSLFTKSDCSEECFDDRVISKARECLNQFMKLPRKNPSGQVQRERNQAAATAMSGRDIEKLVEEHRRSFSLPMKKHSATKSSSFSSTLSSSDSSTCSSVSSANSNGFYELHLLKRSSSANSEIESSVEGAIAYCKQSLQVFCSRIEDPRKGSLRELLEKGQEH